MHRLALDYFDLPRNHSAYLQDATVFVRDEIAKLASDTLTQLDGLSESKNEAAQGKYDYIIHDVFTGGAEPAALFSEMFIRSLSYLLKPNGVIAIVSLPVSFVVNIFECGSVPRLITVRRIMPRISACLQPLMCSRPS